MSKSSTERLADAEKPTNQLTERPPHHPRHHPLGRGRRRRLPGSVVAQAIAAGRSRSRSGDEAEAPAPASQVESQGRPNVLSVTVGQPAGLSTASVKLEDSLPKSIVYVRTANRIIAGEVDVPPGLL